MSWEEQNQADFRLSDDDWRRLKRVGNLPDTFAGADLRVLLGLEIGHARLSMKEFAEEPPIKLVRSQLGKIATRRLGKPFGFLPHPRVVALIAGQAWLDPDHGNSEWARLHEFSSVWGGLERSTANSRRWARRARRLGAGARPHFRATGGSSELPEAIFISVLLNLWARTLNRRIVNWADDDSGGDEHGDAPDEKNSAPLTSFVRAALTIAGVRHHGKLLTLSATRKRIRRVLREMNAAADKGLEWNVLSRMLNPAGAPQDAGVPKK